MFGRDLFSPINFQVEDEMASARQVFGGRIMRPGSSAR
jgi:hypothetical protein